jgi:hypothetical protein
LFEGGFACADVVEPGGVLVVVDVLVRRQGVHSDSQTDGPAGGLSIESLLVKSELNLSLCEVQSERARGVRKLN